ESDKLSDITEQWLKKIGKFERFHGSRDYFRFCQKSLSKDTDDMERRVGQRVIFEHAQKYTTNPLVKKNGIFLTYQDRFVFEVVPIRAIKKAEDAANITDVSPLHAAWVKKKSTEKICDDIRLAKAFCKAQRMYGAESYISGFSGYVLEILIIHYGSFEKFLKAAAGWREGTIIDYSHWYKNAQDVLLSINKAKLQSPLIVVDPVDKTRNAAAALGIEKWLLLKKKSAQFLRKPSARFFTKTKMTIDMLKKKTGVWIEFSSPKGQHDKVGAQIVKTFEHVKKNLLGFGMIAANWEWDDKVVFWFVVKTKKRPSSVLRKGPPLEMKEHVQQFMKKHKKIVKKNGHAWAQVKQAATLKEVVHDVVEKGMKVKMFS
ncbi:MAG TPA: hypothetical protein VJK72_04860, partial [Candidatus Nanoarchaeia archaeon]|nr:hypothetical protein [Candidatus Nanoarchaeia archaeon]